jgi:hypothetical protein
MAVELNHVIFRAKDKWASARFLAGILGIEAGPECGRFVPVRVANGVRYLVRAVRGPAMADQAVRICRGPSIDTPGPRWQSADRWRTAA